MPGGRPIELDAARANQIVAILQRGLPISDACEAAGVAERTFYNWMKRGERASKKKTPTESERPFLQFWQAVKSARATGKLTLVDLIEGAARGNGPTVPGDWKAAAWLLERMHPQQFGRKYIRIEAGGTPDGDPNPGAKPPEVRLVFEGGPVEHPPIVDVPET